MKTIKLSDLEEKINRNNEKYADIINNFKSYILNESDAQKILETPRTILPEINVFSDLNLSDKERIAHTAKIFKSWKNN